uniref:Uncharacterized protein n=1 Tax=Zea mays TaxID=4577 RepID=A0A804NNT4_MAIZE
MTLRKSLIVFRTVILTRFILSKAMAFRKVIDKSFGFHAAVEEAQRALNAAHVEAESVDNGIGVVKLMGHNCCFTAVCFSS